MRRPAGTRRLSRRLRGGWSARSAARRTSKRHRGAFSGPSRRCAGCQRREPCASTARHCSSCSAAGASFGGCAPKSRWTPALPWAAPLPAPSGGIKRRPALSRRLAAASPRRRPASGRRGWGERSSRSSSRRTSATRRCRPEAPAAARCSWWSCASSPGGASIISCSPGWSMASCRRVRQPIRSSPTTSAAPSTARRGAPCSARDPSLASRGCCRRVRRKSRCSSTSRSAPRAARPPCSGPAPTRRAATPCAPRSRTRRRAPSAGSLRSCRSSRSLWPGSARIRPSCSRAPPSTRSPSPPTG